MTKGKRSHPATPQNCIPPDLQLWKYEHIIDVCRSITIPSACPSVNLSTPVPALVWERSLTSTDSGVDLVGGGLSGTL